MTCLGTPSIVTSLSPNAGALSTGTSVTITGTGFSNVTATATNGYTFSNGQTTLTLTGTLEARMSALERTRARSP